MTRETKWNIHIIQEMNSITRSEALEIVYDCIEDVMNAVDIKTFNQVHRLKASGGNISQYQNEHGNVLIGTVELFITYLHQI